MLPLRWHRYRSHRAQLNSEDIETHAEGLGNLPGEVQVEGAGLGRRAFLLGQASAPTKSKKWALTHEQEFFSLKARTEKLPFYALTLLCLSQSVALYG